MRAPADFKNEINECFLKYQDDPEVQHACKVMAAMSEHRGMAFYDCWYSLGLQLEARDEARKWYELTVLKGKQRPTITT